MKLTTPEQKLIEAAKLDGWTMHKVYPHVMCFYEGKKLLHESNVDARMITRYSTSYDAILPLIQKLTKNSEEPMDFAYLFGKALCNLMYGYETTSLDYAEAFGIYVQATPSQLLDALLMAHGFEV